MTSSERWMSRDEAKLERCALAGAILLATETEQKHIQKHIQKHTQNRTKLEMGEEVYCTSVLI